LRAGSVSLPITGTGYERVRERQRLIETIRGYEIGDMGISVRPISEEIAEARGAKFYVVIQWQDSPAPAGMPYGSKAASAYFDSLPSYDDLMDWVDESFADNPNYPGSGDSFTVIGIGVI
jgi:hypothetical protein